MKEDSKKKKWLKRLVIDLGNLRYAQMMPAVFPLASCVPTALKGNMSGENADTANYDVKTEAIAHVAMSEDRSGT